MDSEKEAKIQRLLRSDPLGFINKSADPAMPTNYTNWNRYLPFHRHGNRWVPYHKTYCALWAAIKWGCSHWSATEHFVMDINLGQIVYNDWEKEDE